MEKKKMKMGISGIMIVALTFTLIGVVFLSVGSSIYLTLREGMPETIIFLIVFDGLGILFFILGLLFFFILIRKRMKIRRLLEKGNYIMAEVSEILRNDTIQINSRHPYVVKCRYQDGFGKIHIFKSRNLMYNPRGILKDNMVRVYVDGENYKHYYVAIDEILPEVYEH